ncbi:exopolysaccharide biosynthesis predicted pyruvyl transferase EpsI [Salibacterium salarium]|uniref:polysaccharide pyruvyl transferase family protein n=1 Tax=Salibacterium salarium TaxID=284579 RepID=UPI00278099D4|nr:polysaccharide pyruvyl transferase family protein [Salibacterium salarium]MDQ0300696.1 exopolysaccharide biosynthesis predicted pyruvyl transferase EpsI [Salibacterium salarium]
MEKLPRGFSNFQKGIQTSRKRLLTSIASAPDLTFIIPGGNIGDHLIWSGTRQLLDGKQYKEILKDEIDQADGHTAVIAGSGGWCKAYHSMPRQLAIIEKNFKNVIIFPSSFDISVPAVKEALTKTKATVFARELISYKQIKNLCDANIAYDGAFYFDYTNYKQKGKGTLHAYRNDKEKGKNDMNTVESNNDISKTSKTLDEFLGTVSKHNTIHTDRAHVMIAGAMLNKTVYYSPSNYHKIPGIAKFSLQDFPVREK